MEGNENINLQSLNLGLTLLSLVEGLDGELGDVTDGLAIGSDLLPSNYELRIFE